MRKNPDLSRTCTFCGKQYKLEDENATYAMCSQECRIASELAHRAKHEMQCCLPRCDEERATFAESRLQPQFCCEDHAQEYFNTMPVDRKICAREGCDNTVKFELHKMRKPQKYCGAQCRQLSNPRTTSSKKSRAKERKDKMTMAWVNLEIMREAWRRPIRKDNKVVQKWADLGDKTRQRREDEGWNEEEWDAGILSYSSAMDRGEIPDYVQMKRSEFAKLEEQRIASTL